MDPFPAAGPPAASIRPVAPPLAGRGPELARLDEGLARVRGGQPGHGIWLAGPAGIGKSRLLDAFAGACANAGPIAFVRGAFPEQRRAPYAPFAPMLEALAPLWRANCPEAFERLGPACATVVPALNLTPLAPLAPASERLRFQGAIAELCGALARARGLVLAVEDAQWADLLSEELLAALLRVAGEAPLLVVVTSQALRHAHAPWTERVARVAVEALGPQALASLVLERLATADLPAGLLDRLAAEALGNPRRTLQCLDAWQAWGELVHDGGRWQLLTRDSAPQAPHDALAQREAALDALGPAARTLCGLIALFGGPCELGLLADASPLDAATHKATLAALEAAGLVERCEPDACRLVDSEGRAALEQAAPPAARLAVARALGERIALHPLALAPLALVTAAAHHALVAGDFERALPFALAAGSRHAGLFANEAAERFLADGLALARDRAVPLAPHVRLAYAQHLGDVRRVTGRYRAAAEAYDAVLPWAGAVAPTAVAIGLWTSRAQVHQGLGELDAARACCEQGLALDPEGREPAALARCLMTSARLYQLAQAPVAANQALERALALAKQAGDRAREAEALAFLGHARLAGPADRAREGLDAMHEAVTILTQLGDKPGLVMGYLVLGNAQLALGDFMPAERSFTIGLWVTQEIGNRTEEGIACLNLASTALELGNLTGAWRLAERARENASALDNRFQLALAQGMGALARARLGHLADARHGLGAAVALAKTLDTPYLDGLLAPIVAETCLWLGDRAGALAALGAPDAEPQVAADTLPEGAARRSLLRAELAAGDGEPAAATHLAERALRLAEASRAKGERVRALVVLARLARQAGDWPAVRRLALEGLSSALRLGMRFQQAECEGLLGAESAAEGRPDTVERFEAMKRLGTELGSLTLEALGHAGLARAAGDPTIGAAAEAIARERLDAMVLGLDDAAARQARARTRREFEAFVVIRA